MLRGRIVRILGSFMFVLLTLGFGLTSRGLAVDTRIEGDLRVGLTEPTWDNETALIEFSVVIANSLGQPAELSGSGGVSSPLSLRIETSSGQVRWVNQSQRSITALPGVTYHGVPAVNISNEVEVESFTVTCFLQHLDDIFSPTIEAAVEGFGLRIISHTQLPRVRPGTTEVTGEEAHRFIWKLAFLILSIGLFASLASELSKRMVAA